MSLLALVPTRKTVSCCFLPMGAFEHHCTKFPGVNQQQTWTIMTRAVETDMANSTRSLTRALTKCRELDRLRRHALGDREPEFRDVRVPAVGDVDAFVAHGSTG